MEIGIESAIFLYHEAYVEKGERKIKRETDRRRLSDQKKKGCQSWVSNKTSRIKCSTELLITN